jgi:6-pyruvoyltetrahydropterin/6-carboxytetrahydropterin synthase
MHTEIARVFTFEAAHLLPNVPNGHKCGRLHGHSYRVILRISGEVDPVSGWIVDFGEIDAACRPIFQQLDHGYLNEIPGLDNPTSENLARWIFDRVDLPGGVLRSVTVSETCTSECTVYGDEPGR